MATWIVLADGRHARIYERLAPGARLRSVLEHDLVAADEHGFSRDLGADRPGRAFDPGSGTPHAMEPRSDPHERSKAAFAKRVAALLDEAVASKRCENLVLIAPPKTLGSLRGELGPAALACVTASAGKDLLKTPIAELPAHVDQVMAERRFVL